MTDFHRFGLADWGALALPIAGKRLDNARLSNPVPAVDSVAWTAPALPNALKSARHGAPPDTAGKSRGGRFGSNGAKVSMALSTPSPRVIQARSTAAALPGPGRLPQPPWTELAVMDWS